MQRTIKGCALVGFPDDLGVSNVGGRAGAADGPAAFRRSLLALKNASNLDLLEDCGDVDGFTTSIEDNHARAASALQGAHSKIGLSIVVGGGHDYAFAQLRGILGAYGGEAHTLRIGCINLDRHLDLRTPAPLITSGSGFYLSIESGLLDASRLVEFGIQRDSNGPDLWNYARDRGITIREFEDLRRGGPARVLSTVLLELCARCDIIVASLDLDCVMSTFAPGVSSPASEGFAPDEILEMMDVFGKNGKVLSLGIFELNPKYDKNEQTARLAASAAYRFLTNATRRKHEVVLFG